MHVWANALVGALGSGESAEDVAGLLPDDDQPPSPGGPAGFDDGDEREGDNRDAHDHRAVDGQGDGWDLEAWHEQGTFREVSGGESSTEYGAADPGYEV